MCTCEPQLCRKCAQLTPTNSAHARSKNEDPARVAQREFASLVPPGTRVSLKRCEQPHPNGCIGYVTEIDKRPLYKGLLVVTLTDGLVIRKLRPYNIEIEAFEGENEEDEEEDPSQARGFETRAMDNPPPPPDEWCFSGNRRRCD